MLCFPNNTTSFAEHLMARNENMFTGMIYRVVYILYNSFLS